jgi:hypothetical protein
MPLFAIELNDRALALASEGRLLSVAPSAVFDGSGAEPAGAPAWQWLRRRPTATSTRHLRELSRPGPTGRRAHTLVSAELARRLHAHAPLPGSRVWIASGAALEPHGLSILLGVTRELKLPVDGFVDAAVVSAAALGLDRAALALDLGLHHTAVTAIEAGGQVRRRRLVSGTRGGLIELYQAWMSLIGTTLVKRTRFDPLHDAATEQQLFDALPALARAAVADGSALASITVAGHSYETTLSRDQLAEAAEPIYAEMLALLHALRPAGAPVALLVPQAALEIPGLREALEGFSGCELVALAEGFAAAALSTLELPRRASEDPVRLLRRLPSRIVARCAALATREILGRDLAPAPPTHILLEGTTYVLGRGSLTVGREPGEVPAIRLPEGLAGISRRHCTFVREGAETVLVDHSRCGTFVNGERVAERARVRAGDRVRVGEPGIELALISVTEALASDEQHDATA